MKKRFFAAGSAEQLNSPQIPLSMQRRPEEETGHTITHVSKNIAINYHNVGFGDDVDKLAVIVDDG